MQDKVGNPVGWWKISVSLKNLRKLDEIKQKLENEVGERLSYNKVIQHLIEHYLKNCSYGFINSKKYAKHG